VAGDRPPVSAPAFWEALYASSQDGWELGEPAPSLVAWLDGGGSFASGARVAVPGAGRGQGEELDTVADAMGRSGPAGSLHEQRRERHSARTS